MQLKIKKNRALKSTYNAEAGTLQVTPLKRPYGTRVYPFSAASFLPWHGSRERVAQDLNINVPYKILPSTR